MEEKQMPKSDGGHMDMAAMKKVNDPPTNEGALKTIVSHQEHDENDKRHIIHHF